MPCKDNYTSRVDVGVSVEYIVKFCECVILLLGDSSLPSGCYAVAKEECSISRGGYIRAVIQRMEGCGQRTPTAVVEQPHLMGVSWDRSGQVGVVYCITSRPVPCPQEGKILIFSW